MKIYLITFLHYLDDQICGSCHRKVIVSGIIYFMFYYHFFFSISKFTIHIDPRQQTVGMVVFFCRHAFHSDCLNALVGF